MKEPGEIKLKSGAKLKVQVSPFAVSKALYQSMLKELKNVGLSSKTELANVFKEIFCAAFSSPEIEACMWACMERCTLNGEKITEDTFEPVERRDDYMQVCMEVAKANVLPFAKSLYAEYQHQLSIIEKSPA